jgi:predicted  nucleic acid-binding Zn-ribbon protein
VDPQLQTLIELQGYDARISALDAEAARLPKQIESIQNSLAEAKKQVDTIKGRLDVTRKELRGKEKDLEVISAKRSKLEARLYEVKTNKEYSAALLEIEESKQEKAKTEEEILGLMELQERLNVEIREAETRLKTRQEQANQDEAVVRKKLAAVEQELGGVRGERTTRAKDLPPGLLADYDRLLRARNGVAVAAVSTSAFCGGCRVSIRPQAIQELRSATTAMMRCESCGRYLYWQE